MAGVGIDFEKLDGEHKQVINQLLDSLQKSLKSAIENNEISQEEIDFSKQSLFSLGVGREIFLEAINEIELGDKTVAQHMNAALAHILIGAYGAGGLVVESDSLIKQFQNKFKKAQTRKALQEIEKTKLPGRNIEDDAIRYVLSRPLERDLNKRKGPYAYAGRLVGTANQWLKEHGAPGTLTDTAIAKRLKRRPADFPPPDKWPK